MLGERSAITVDGSLEERIAALARHQRGRVSRGQLLYAGIAVTRITWGQLHGELLAVIARLAFSLSAAHTGGR